MHDRLKGTGVAIVTPFTADLKVDFAGLSKLVEFLITGGVEYLVVQGTTGESVTLTKSEKRAVLDTVIETAQGRVPIILGHGGNHTAEILESFANFDFGKVDGILSVSPAYNKPTQEGIYRHFEAVSKASPVPIVLYNVPGRTASNMLADTTLSLARDFENIIAIKEASGNLDQIGKIIRGRPEGFLVISGDDGLIVPHMALGGDGIISVIANALPTQFSNLVRAAAAQDYAKARELFYRVDDLIALLFVDGNPAGVKAALNVRGVCGDAVRLPLVGIRPETRQKIEAELAQILAD